MNPATENAPTEYSRGYFDGKAGLECQPILKNTSMDIRKAERLPGYMVKQSDMTDDHVKE